MVHDQLIFILTLLISVNFCYNQLIPTNTHPLDIEIKPERVIINSTSITNFLCINHQSNGEQLEANLSKPIPINQMKLTKTFLNRTTINIRLESNNYVGIFHVTCHLKGEENKGNRADVIVKGPSGVLQLVERCRVYERQYTKCIIRAPVIASAIKNGFPEVFEFDEITHFSDSRAYLQRFEFLKNESTNENLVFKWKPAVEGVFPNGVRMHMKAMLRYFDPSSYYFDMTPIFVIKPKFIATALSRSEIQVNLTSISSAPFCEKSILPKITSNINQTWTVIEPERNSIVINNLVSNTIHRLCVKCRQLYTDPEGVEECVDVKTKSTFDVIEEYKWFPIIGILFLVSIIALIVFVWYRKRGVAYKPVTQQSSKSEIQKSTQNIYDLEQPETGEPTDSVNNHDRTLNIRDDTSKRIPNSGERYPHVADIGEAIGACDQQWLV